MTKTMIDLLRRLRRAALLLVALGGLAGCGADNQAPDTAAPTGELRVVTSGGFSSAYRRLLPDFESGSGIRVTTEYGASTGGAPDSIPERLSRGERFDVVILSRPSLDQLSARGYVLADSASDLVRSRIGMAVRDGADVPDIGTAEKFTAVLLAAESIGYSASVSGTYLSKDLLPRLGIWDQLEPKSTRIVSERVAEVVARGEVEIGFQQVSEILSVEGATLVAPIPEEYQLVTTFSAAITTGAKNPDGARRLIEFLSALEVADVIAATGLDPVALEP